MPTWNNVQIEVENTLAAADTITGISKANPAVVTATGHGVTANKVVKLAVSGMPRLDERAFKATAVDANTVTLGGVDSTNFTDFASGTLTEVSTWTAMTTVRSVSGSGGEPSPIDQSTVHEDIARQAPGRKSAITYTLTNNWKPGDAALIKLRAADEAQSIIAVRMTFASGEVVVAACTVSCPLTPGGTDNVETTATLYVKGYPMAYAAS